jgi:hypothetical protein
MRFIFREQPFPRGVVICVFFRSRLVTVERPENVEVRSDRPEVARGDHLGRDGVRALEPDELKERMVGRQVAPLPIQGVADDLSDALFAHALLARDLPLGFAQAQAGEDAFSPQGFGVGVELRPRRPGNSFRIHAAFLFRRGPVAALVSAPQRDRVGLTASITHAPRSALRWIWISP